MFGASNESSAIIVWSLVLFAFVIAGFLVVAWLKKRLKEPDQTPSAGFTLSDLREMHRSGQLSAEEFERARARMAAGLKKPDKPSTPS